MVDEPVGPEAELADALVVEAAAARRRLRRERELGGAEATLRGLVTGLAEAGATAVVVTDLGHRLVGTIGDRGPDVVGVELAEGGVAAIRWSSVVAVETPGSEPTGATRPEGPDGPRHLADVVADYVDADLEVTLWLSGGTRVDGEIVSCGVDLVVVRPRGGGAASYVALESVNEVWSSSTP